MSQYYYRKRELIGYGHSHILWANLVMNNKEQILKACSDHEISNTIQKFDVSWI